nr:unnamed protein product [Callosobruchus analis]
MVCHLTPYKILLERCRSMSKRCRSRALDSIVSNTSLRTFLYGQPPKAESLWCCRSAATGQVPLRLQPMQDVAIGNKFHGSTFHLFEVDLYRRTCWLLVISLSRLRSDLESHNRSYWDQLIYSLKDSIAQDVVKLQDYINHSTSALTRQPLTIEEIGESGVVHENILKEAPLVSQRRYQKDTVEWGLVNKVQFNVPKTQATTLKRKSHDGLSTVEMEGRLIGESPSVNNTMSWHDHVITIIERASMKLGVLFRCWQLYTP